MIGLIDLQQALSYSSVAEKVQQVKQENLLVYQQQTVAETKEKDIQKQRELNETNKTDDVKIRDKENKKRKNKEENKKRNSKEEDALAAKQQLEHKVDIIA